jgi:hypothetical protein
MVGIPYQDSYVGLPYHLLNYMFGKSDVTRDDILFLLMLFDESEKWPGLRPVPVDTAKALADSRMPQLGDQFDSIIQTLLKDQIIEYHTNKVDRLCYRFIAESDPDVVVEKD